MNWIKARTCTLLFAFLPRRAQTWLWERISDAYGYTGFHANMKGGTVYFIGTPKREDSLYHKLRERENNMEKCRKQEDA